MAAVALRAALRAVLLRAGSNSFFESSFVLRRFLLRCTGRGLYWSLVQQLVEVWTLC